MGNKVGGFLNAMGRGLRNFLTKKRGGGKEAASEEEFSERSERWKETIHFNIIPFIIGIILSGILFLWLFPNSLLFVAGVLFSFSLLFPAEGGMGAVKAVFHGMAFSLAIFAMWWNRFLTFVTAFVAYLVISVNEASGEAWNYESVATIFQLIFVAIISLVLYFTCYGGMLGFGMALLSAGLLLAFPSHERESGKAVIVVKAFKEEYVNFIGGALALIGYAMVSLYLLSTFQSFLSIQFVLFALIGLGAVIAAFTTPPYSRAPTGFVFLLALLLITTTAYPSVIGSSLFGPIWWSKIESTFSPVFEPLADAIEQAQKGMSDMWLALTCPQCYWEKMQREQREQSISRGTVKSVEVGEFRFYGNVNYLDPEGWLEGYVVFQNQGEFPANSLEFSMGDTEIYFPEESKWKKLEGVEKKITLCVGGVKGDATCSWNEEILPGGARQLDFTLDFSNATLDNKSFAMCRCAPDGKECACESCTCEEGKHKIYIYGEREARIKFTYSFEYTTTARLETQVINREEYRKMEKEGKIMEEKTSEYLGGPLKISIITRPGTLVSGEEGEGYVVLSFRNTGEGEITSLKAHVYIPKDFKVEKEEAKGNWISCEPVTSERAGYAKMECTMKEEKTLKSEEGDRAYVKIPFSFALSETVPMKTYVITANVTYSCEREIIRKLTVLPAP